MGLWKPLSVQEEPVTEITSWLILRATFGENSTSDHVVGWAGEGRASSAIKEKRLDEGVVVTTSGRQYKLVGPSRSDPDALYVWRRWCEINSVLDFVDASDEYAAAMEASETGLD